MLDPDFEARPSWLDVSRETFELLGQFAALVRQWTKKINLISPATVPEIWSRHILDSAQLYFLAPSRPTWADLGSGGGFPSVVLAILARQANPAAKFHLVESDQRKSAFLRKACLDLGVAATIHPVRAEQLSPLQADVVTARALAPLTTLLPMVARHLAPGGTAILPKGARAEDEIAAVQKDWSFKLTAQPSKTDPSAQILILDDLHHV